MSIIRFLRAFMTNFVFATLLFISPILANSNQDTASVAIANAEETILSTYSAVLEAEQAGGNVSSLFARLNDAGELLAAARMSYRNEDFDNATRFASSSKNIGEEVKNAAYELKDLALNEGVQRIWFTMLGSVFSIFSVVFSSLWVWRFLKRRYP